MEKHILPADDTAVADLTADIIEALAATLQRRCNISESATTGEAVIELLRGELGGTRRFRLQLIETTEEAP